MRVLFFVAGIVVWMAAGLRAERVEVASLSTVMADFARQIGGERVEVVEIVKPGVDPHVFEPSPGDYKAISGARILLASGLGFEGYLDKLRQAVAKDGVRVVVAGDVVRTIEASGSCEGHDHDHDHDHAHHHHGSVDPHWWHSVENARLVAAQIRDALAEVDPEGRGEYFQNAKELDGRLAELAKWTRKRVAELPKSARVLVTSHDALGYFAKDYGFEVLAVQGISTTEQPSSRRVQELIGEIRGRGVKAIFAENIENPKVLEEITKETGAKPGGILYADGLGTGAAGSYEGMMRANVDTIVGALGGE
jgi:zinc/manganese transport system substrate-binding protein